MKKFYFLCTSLLLGLVANATCPITEGKQIFLLQMEKEEAKQERAFEHTNYGVCKGLLRRKQRSSRLQTDEYYHKPREDRRTSS